MTVVVVTPCFNQADTLVATIETVRDQTFRPVEHVVVNDGSTDNTAEVLAAYPHVRAVTVTNRGFANALNAGLLAAKPSEWVAVVCADDCVPADYLAEMVDAGRGADAVVAAIRYFGDSADHEPVLPERLNPSPRELWERCWTNFCPMFRRDALVECGGFHGLMSGDADWDLWLDFAFRGYRVAYTDRTFYGYRLHEGQWTQTHAPLERKDNRAEMWRHHQLADKGFPER